MNELVPKRKLSSELQKFVDNKSGQKIKEIKEDDLKSNLLGIVSMIGIDCGSPLSAKDQSYLTIRLCTILSEDYKGFTVKEVKEAFEKGVRGDYGEIYGLNIKTFCKFLREYSKMRKETAIKLLGEKTKETGMPIDAAASEILGGLINKGLKDGVKKSIENDKSKSELRKAGNIGEIIKKSRTKK